MRGGEKKDGGDKAPNNKHTLQRQVPYTKNNDREVAYMVRTRLGRRYRRKLKNVRKKGRGGGRTGGVEKKKENFLLSLNKWQQNQKAFGGE